MVGIAEAVGFTTDSDSVGSPGSILLYDPVLHHDGLHSYCSWMRGIDCSGDHENQLPNIIRWQGMNLTGTISAEINKLHNLSILWLYDNNLQGTIPAMDLSKLTDLQLHHNSLVGLFPDGIFPRLGRLTINDNALTGTIPFHLDKTMPVLERLYVGNNHFGGFIPGDIPFFHDKVLDSSILCDFTQDNDTNHWECPMPEKDSHANSCELPAC